MLQYNSIGIKHFSHLHLTFVVCINEQNTLNSSWRAELQFWSCQVLLCGWFLFNNLFYYDLKYAINDLLICNVIKIQPKCKHNGSYCSVEILRSYIRRVQKLKLARKIAKNGQNHIRAIQATIILTWSQFDSSQCFNCEEGIVLLCWMCLIHMLKI